MKEANFRKAPDPIPGKDGNDGAQGLDGKDGPQGPQGERGFDGKDGRDGKDGLNGVNGRNGLNGKDGKNGLDGKRGPKGDQGEIGLQGEQGPQGEPGPKGDKGDKGDTGPMPDHQISKKDGKVRFKRDDGTWGAWLEIKQEIVDRTVTVQESGGRGEQVTKAISDINTLNGLVPYVKWNSGNGLLTWNSPYAVQTSATTVTYQSGVVRFVDADEETTTVTTVPFAGKENETDDCIVDCFRTTWAVGRDGTVSQFEGPLSAAQKRDYIQIFVSAHFDKTQIDVVAISPDIGYETGNRLTDIQDAVRFVNFNGGNVYSATGSTNQLAKTAGECFANAGRNFSQSTASPNVAVQTALDPISGLGPAGFPNMVEGWRDGSGGSTIAAILDGEIDTTKYDDGSGTLATLPDGYWVTDRIYMEPALNTTGIVHGQEIHKGKVQALNAINVEQFESIPASDEFVLRGAITYRKGETGFVNNSNVIISKADKYGTLIVNSVSGSTNLGVPHWIPDFFTSRGVSAGTYYMFGDYLWDSSDITLTQASSTLSYGSANAAYGMRPGAVFAGDGTVDTGQVGLRVTGTTMTDAGVRTPNDTQVITDDITSPILNDYIETEKKFIGQVTYELYVVSGSPTTYSVSFNYGLSKYEDAGNRDFMLTDIQFGGLAGATDTSAEIEVLKHSPDNWTYAATGFVPGNGVITSMQSVYGTEDNLINDQPFHFKLDATSTDMNVPICGADDEGIVVRIVAAQNNTFQSITGQLGVEF